MDTWGSFLGGLTIALQPASLFYCFIGVFAGTLVGVLPGIGPVGGHGSYTSDNVSPDSPLRRSSCYAGSPMEPPTGDQQQQSWSISRARSNAVVTCFDGYQMAKNGRAGPALGIAAFGSFIAGTVSTVGLMLVAPALARAALRFGSPEYFSLMLMSMVHGDLSGERLHA